MKFDPVGLLMTSSKRFTTRFSRREQARLFLIVGMKVSLMHVLHHQLEELGFGAGAFGLDPCPAESAAPAPAPTAARPSNRAGGESSQLNSPSLLQTNG